MACQRRRPGKHGWYSRLRERRPLQLRPLPRQLLSLPRQVWRDHRSECLEEQERRWPKERSVQGFVFKGLEELQWLL